MRGGGEATIDSRSPARVIPIRIMVTTIAFIAVLQLSSALN
jgi:hypothetical protein